VNQGEMRDGGEGLIDLDLPEYQGRARDAAAPPPV
jgi:hypothetical protein